MSDEKDTSKQFIEEPPEDLELKDEDAEQVRGGDDAALASNVLKTKHDAAQSAINNIRG